MEEFGEKEALAAHKDVYHREFKCEEQGCSFKAKTEANMKSHSLLLLASISGKGVSVNPAELFRGTSGVPWSIL